MVDSLGIRAWLIEDDDLDAALAERMLMDAGVETLRSDASVMRTPSDDSRIDLIVLDIGLGSHSGLDLLRALRRRGDERPVLVLTGRSDSRTAMECIRAGADDFVCKADLQKDLLTRAIENTFLRSEARARERAQQERIEELSVLSARLSRLATTDPLTGLANRRTFEDRLDQELAAAERYGETPVLLWMDLDEFKTINDSMGHAEGDRVLKEMADALRNTIRRTDVAARVGGDEFAVILCRIDLDSGWRVASRIIRAASAIRWGPQRASLGVSIGIAPYRKESSAEDMMRRGDRALYEAKGSGHSVRIDGGDSRCEDLR